MTAWIGTSRSGPAAPSATTDPGRLGKRRSSSEKRTESYTPRGRAVFKRECSACHQLEGVGTPIGAELNGIRDQGSETILLNILDPNREVKPQYLSYALVTDAGRIVTGMITAETANGLSLRRADGTSETV